MTEFNLVDPQVEEEAPATQPSAFFADQGVRTRGIDRGTLIAGKSAMTELRNTARELAAGGYGDELSSALEGDKGILDLGSGFTNELFDFLQIGQFTTAGSASELLVSGSPSAALRRAGVEFAHALPGDLLENAALSLVGALDPSKTIAEIKAMPVMEASWADVLSGRGLTDERKEELAQGTDALSRLATSSFAFGEEHTTTIAATGFILDVLLDPTTYFGYGVTKAVRGLNAFDGFIGKALPGTQHSVSQYLKQSRPGAGFRKMFIPRSLERGLAEGEHAAEIANALNDFRGFKEGQEGFLEAQDIMDWGNKYLQEFSQIQRKQRIENKAIVDTIYNVAGSLSQDELLVMGLYGDQPKAFEAILPKLGLTGDQMDGMRDALKVMKDTMGKWFDAEESAGILSPGQHRSHYMYGTLTQDPKMKQILVSTMKARYGAEVGEMVAKRIDDMQKVVVYGKGADGVPQKATFEYTSSYANTAQRTMAGVPVELNAAVSTVMRGFDHTRRMTTENFYKAVLSDTGVAIPVDQAIADAATRAASATTEARTQLEMLRKSGMDVLRIKAPGSGEDAFYAMPAAMKEAFEKSNKVFADPDEAHALFQTVKNMTSIWKGYALLSPGFHIRNVMSGVFNNWIADMNISDPDTWRSYWEAMLLVMRDTRNMPAGMREKAENFFGGTKALADMKFKFGDDAIDGLGLVDEVHAAGLRAGGQIAHEGAAESLEREVQRGVGQDFHAAGEKINITDGLDGWGDATERVGKVSGQFKEMFKRAGAVELADDEYKAMAEMYDLVAKSWAWRTGRTPIEFWKEKLVFSDAFKAKKLKNIKEEIKAGNPTVIASRTPGKNKGGKSAGLLTFEDGNAAAVDLLQKGKAFFRLNENATAETMTQALGTIIRRLMLDVGDQHTLTRWATNKGAVDNAIGKFAKQLNKSVDALSEGEKMAALETLWTPAVERKFGKSFAHFLGRGTEGLNINNAMQGTFDRIRDSLDGIYRFSEGEHGSAIFNKGGQAWRKVRTLIGEGMDENPEDLTTLKAVLTASDEAGTAGAKVKRGFGNIGDNSILDANREVGKTMEYFLRSAHYIFKRKKGFTQEAAETSVKTYHFDYNELTEFERKYMKMVIPFYCVPDTYEILTRNGWEKVDDLVPGETEVVAYDHDSGETFWKKLDEVAIFDYDGELLKLGNRSSGYFLSTPNHRWPTINHKKDRQIRRTYQLKSNHKIPLVSDSHVFDDTSGITEREGSILGWILTDGCIDKDGTRITIVQSKHPYVDHIRALLGDDCSEYTFERHSDTQKDCTTFTLNGKLLKRMLEILPNKEVAPRIVTTLSREAAQAMWDAMYDGDGTTTKNRNSDFFAQENKAVLDAFQILTLSLGRVMQKADNGRGGYVRKRGQKYVKVWDEERGTSLTPEWYKGRVWCPHLDNLCWYTRNEKGKVILGGNTWMRKNIPLQLTELIRQPERYAKIPKVMDAIENLTPELDNLPTPDYFDEVNAVRLPWDGGAIDEDANGLPMYIIPDLPYQDLGRINLRDWLSSLNPLIKMPIELLGPKGYSIFLDRPIEKFPGEPAFAGEDFSVGKKTIAAVETLAPPIGKYITRPMKAYREGKLTEELMRTMLATGIRTSDPDRNAMAGIFTKRNAVRQAKQKILARRRMAGLD